MLSVVTFIPIHWALYFKVFQKKGIICSRKLKSKHIHLFPNMNENYNEKLAFTLSKYKLSVKRLKQLRPTTILLEPMSITETNFFKPCRKNQQSTSTSCASKKKNGLPCPSIKKKGSLYCHRHTKVHAQIK